MVDPPSHREESSNSVNQEFLDSLKSMMLEMKADLEKIKTEQSKKSTHQSESEKYYSSSRSRSSRRRVHREDLEQRLPQTQTRDPLADYKLPSFHGTTDPEEYLEWERMIEKVFDSREYTHTKKIQLASSVFKGYALSWWDELVNARRKVGDLPIDSWSQLKTIMRRKFVPNHYHREQHLRYRTSSQETNTKTSFSSSRFNSSRSNSSKENGSSAKKSKPLSKANIEEPTLKDKETVLVALTPQGVLLDQMDLNKTHSELKQPTKLLAAQLQESPLSPSLIQPNVVPEKLVSLGPEQPSSIISTLSAFEPERLTTLEPVQPSSFVPIS